MRMEQAIVDRLAAIPGVDAVAASRAVLPMDSQGWSDPVYERRPPRAGKPASPLRHSNSISPGLFAAMGNHLVAGRDFTWNELYAKRPWP